MLNLKKGVKLRGLKPETLAAMLVVRGVYDRLGLTHTVTSVCDGRHRSDSLHYDGYAFDNRTWADRSGAQISEDDKFELALLIKEALGDEFDVVIESTHIHIEFDPD
jgi:hypothetical protein